MENKKLKINSKDEGIRMLAINQILDNHTKDKVKKKQLKRVKN